MPSAFAENCQYFFSGAKRRQSIIQLPLGHTLAPQEKQEKGAYGVVRHFRSDKDSELVEYAVKKTIPGRCTLENFQEECRLWNLANPQFPAYIVIKDDNFRYIMPYIKGTTLRDFNFTSIKQRIEIAEALIEAIDNLWQKGIVHNDLNPGNIIIKQDLVKDTAVYQVVIIDFGFAKTGLGEFTHDAKVLRVLLTYITRFFTIPSFDHINALFWDALKRAEKRFIPIDKGEFFDEVDTMEHLSSESLSSLPAFEKIVPVLHHLPEEWQSPENLVVVEKVSFDEDFAEAERSVLRNPTSSDLEECHCATCTHLFNIDVTNSWGVPAWSDQSEDDDELVNTSWALSAWNASPRYGAGSIDDMSLVLEDRALACLEADEDEIDHTPLASSDPHDSPEYWESQTDLSKVEVGAIADKSLWIEPKVLEIEEVDVIESPEEEDTFDFKLFYIYRFFPKSPQKMRHSFDDLDWNIKL